MLRTSLLLLACCATPSLGAAEDTPVEPPAGVASPATAETPADEPSAAERLLRSLAPEDASLLLVEDDQVRWRDGETSFQVTGVIDRQLATVASPIGPIQVERALLSGARPDALAAFAERLALAEAAGLTSSESAPVRFGDSILTGLRLRGGDHLVLADGVLTRVDQSAVPREAALSELAAAQQAVLDALPDSGLGRLAQRSVEEIIRKLDGEDSGEEEGDDVTPSFARRVVRHGWLRDILPDTPATERLATAVEAAVTYQAQLSYRGEADDDLVLEQVVDAFGQGGWFLRTPSATRLAVAPLRPLYHWTAQETLRSAMLVIDFPAGTDFDTAASMRTAPRALRLYHQELPLAWWTAEDGFAADEAAWRSVVPAGGFNLDAQIVSDYMPPHLVVSDLAGDVHRIVTAHGELVPPEAGDQPAAEAFLAQAAEVLPDAAHLDLIGQYLFKYVYDSPDTRLPFLIGSKQMSGDIHQTSLQTLATTTGGMCRGDCDDLSELYEDVLSLQQETAHVISLPAHAAVAWADEQDDGWHVFVMQTGPSLEFVAPRLQDALAMAYKRFDAAETFDPNGLGLLLRFSGENTRSSWRLSYRIFSEPDYAQTMIDVQRDWHFQTYMEGIRKMEDLIASGDDDTANYRELAGLFSFTGQYGKAADYLEQAIERTPEAESKLYESAELVHHLLEADEVERAQAVLENMLLVQLPPLREQLGAATIQLGLQLAGFLQSSDQSELAVQVLDELAADEIAKMTDFIATWLTQRFDQRTWENHPQLRQFRRMLSWHAATTFSILRGIGPDALLANQELREQLPLATRWLDTIAFYDSEEEADIMRSYAVAGTFYGAVLGDKVLLERLEQVEPPAASLVVDHRQRVGGLPQVQLDLPWIRISIPYWQNRLTQLVGDAEPIDRDEVERMATLLEEAAEISDRRDLHSAFISKDLHLARVLVALLSENEADLRQLLQQVKEKNDKRLRDDTAMWIGNAARHLDMDWWQTVITAWREELDYKPKYYWIAWRAALSDAPEHALAMAALAAERFADDPAFVQEERFMRKLLTAPAEPATEEAAEAESAAEEAAEVEPAAEAEVEVEAEAEPAVAP